MALFKYQQRIHFIQGLNKQEDEKLPIIDLRVAENLTMSKLGRLESRFGFSSLPSNTFDGGELSNGEMLKSYGNELLLIGRNSLYSYAEKLSRWVKRADRLTVVNKSVSFSRSPKSQDDPKYVKGLGDINLLVYREEGIYYYDTFEVSSGLKLKSKQPLDLSEDITEVTVMFKEGRFLVLYTTQDNKLILRNTEINEVELKNPIVLQTDVSVESLLRVNDFNNLWINVIYKKTNEKPSGFFLNSVGQIATPSEGLVEKTEIDITLEDRLSVSVKKGAVPEVFLVYTTPAEVRLTHLSNALAVVNTTTIDTQDQVTHITSTVEDKLHILYSGLDNDEEYINRIRYDIPNQTLGDLTFINKDILLASEAFSFGDRVFFVASFDSMFQSCYFIVDSENGNIEGRVDYLTGAGHVVNLLNPVVEGESNFSLMTPTRTRITRDNEVFNTVNGLDIHEFVFETPRNYQASVFSDGLHIAGSVPHVYDSEALVEDGFLVYPEGLKTTPLNYGGGLENTTTTGLEFAKYFYTVVFAWTNAKGLLYRSRPHDVVEVSMGANNNSVELEVPTLRLTKKEDVVIEIYRSEVNGAVNHKIGEVVNNKNVKTITYLDTRGDEGLITQEPLYTTGNVLENSCPRSCKFMTVYQNRLFLAGLRDNKTIQYSHIMREGFPAEFSDFLVTTVPIEEEITGVYGLGNFLAVFAETSCGIIVGEGADVTGIGASYRYETLSKDIGCINFQSFLETNLGLYFQSKKGIFLLTRQGSLEFIGARVKDYNLEITSTQNLQDRHEIRFNTSEYTLVFNEHFQVWTTFTNTGGLSTTTHKNEAYRLNLSGNKVYKESKDYSDDGVAIKPKLKTNWITAEQLGSYQRLYKAAFVGIDNEDHKGRINVYYDYSNDVGEVFEYEGENLNVWGSASWGELEFNSKPREDFFYEVRPRKQKCSAISFEIEVSQESNIPTQGFSLNGLVFTLGAKRGIRKTGKSNKAKPV